LKNCHMNIGHLQEVGVSLCDTIYRFAMSPDGRSSFCSMSTNTPILASPMDLTAAATVAMLSDSISEIPVDTEALDGGSGSDSEDSQPNNGSKSTGKVRDQGSSSSAKFPGPHMQSFMPAIEQSSKSMTQSGLSARPGQHARSLFSKTRSESLRIGSGDGTQDSRYSKQAVDDLVMMRNCKSETVR